MDVRELVTGHYGAGGLTERLLERLAASGVELTALRAEHLHPVDHLHAGGAGATKDLIAALGLSGEERVLDVGSGIGGPSRMAAAFGARVTGVDLTPEFVRTATELTARVGLAHRASFQVASAEELPFDDDSFDVAMMIHVGMNLPDKKQVFGEVHRVLRPGGRFALQEQVRVGDGELPWPMPWAQDERFSFVERTDDYTRKLEAVGFTVESVEDRADLAHNRSPFGGLSPVAVFGEVFATRVANNVAATEAGKLTVVRILATA